MNNRVKPDKPCPPGDKPKPRRRRAGSAAAELAAFQAASSVIEPPANVRLNKAAMTFWQPIMLTRARDEWTETDLLHAANLARCFADIERITLDIEREGDVMENARGTAIANPKHSILETLSRRGLALSRMLHLDANARTDKRDVVAARKAEREAREVLQDAAVGSLLA